MLKQDVPKAPSKKEKVDSKAKENLLGWITFFKELSDRIRLFVPGDKFFDLKHLKQKSIDFIYSPNANLINWPEECDVLFILTINSSLEDEKQNSLFQDTYLFCKRDFCFALDYFQYDNQESIVGYYDYIISLDEDSLKWNFIKNLIIKRLKDLENSVPVLVGLTTANEQY
jgi:hypothetical protein